jgi:hypothetical protein
VEHDFSKMNIETMTEIIKRMAGGELLDDIIPTLIPDDVKATASVLHSLLCYKNHLNDDCTFYKEIEHCWQQDAHREYLAIVQNLIQQGYEVRDIELSIEDLKTIFRILEEAAHCRPIVMLLLQKFLQLNPPSNPPL